MILYEAHNMEPDNPYTMYDVTDLNWELHFHRAYECIFVLQGQIRCKIEQTDYEAAAGDMLFVMPNQLHSFYTPKASHIRLIRFSPELIGHFHNEHFHVVAKYACISMKFPFDDSFSFKNHYMVKAFLYQICAEVVEQTDFIPCDRSAKDLLVHKMLAYVDLHYTEECSLKAAADACCCDYYHASKTFIRYTGLSFVEYVNTLRVHKACYLIRSSEHTFLDIAMQCGFSSLRSFNRNFLTSCGCSPSTYRKQHSASEMHL